MWKVYSEDKPIDNTDFVTLISARDLSRIKIAVCVNGFWYTEDGEIMKKVDFNQYPYWTQIKRPDF